ncbi:peptide/nickel transport system permease protein [Actinopolymorpha cephalotaxi]|uniref:Peptide/nickel transport system permease protein n=1 Tax=Actinopolymorpha cephalotaxi TaxID=504797 RepID=A0A1I2TXA7_9ACTN|nr:ABC transporter permease [Actinopolymorpha cephalotaxi]NYH83184.1 peptide/nickel transport system permease protein [Actinopolymorpha cephalotaxi]SFG67196.1 peptide/nickel transport system permease protein [Actinopolymorpha cephalotaxi]
MLTYMGRRILLMIPTVFAISVVAFIIIQLPPGDYLTTIVSQLQSQGDQIDKAQLAALSARYGLDQPVYVQYLKWIGGILHGDFGMSFAWNKPVSALLGDTLGLTIVLAITTLLFTWAVAFPIGVYSAVRQYSVGDYVATTLGFLGLAVPNFLIALVLMWVGLNYFGLSVGGLNSQDYVDSAWNLGKVIDLLAHLWVPVVVIGTAGTAGLVRVLRANLLDELHKPYVVAARARGMPERRLTVKYPLRVALNPFVSTIGWVLPGLVSGEVIVAQVLSLPTTGPLLLNALKSQDMYLAGSVILIVSVLTVIGTLISDIALAWLDPRVRLSHR